MSEAATALPPRPARRRLRLLLIVAVVALAVLALAAWLAQPPRAGRFLLQRAGDALGLAIKAGRIDYRLRGTPQLVLHDVEASRPGDVPLLRAERLFLSLPWSTVRARGGDLTVTRIELDAPLLDLPALQRWMATRPPSDRPRLPTLTAGIRIRDGRVRNDDWLLEGVQVDLPSLHPDQPARAHVRGRYRAPPLTVPADLWITVSQPGRLLDGAGSGIGAVGRLAVAGPDWQVPASVHLSGPLRIGRDSVLMRPARIGIAARYVSARSTVPFRLGIHGPLAFNQATWRIVPAQVVLDGDGMAPDARARGSLSFGQRLGLRLRGRLAGWPDAWPALPEPLSASRSPLPFALRYVGPMAFTDVTELRLQRDGTTFDARFRLPEVLAWTEAAATGSPLPPLQGTLTTPRLQIAGARLDDVRIKLTEVATP